jgi:hypothetical protein
MFMDKKETSYYDVFIPCPQEVSLLYDSKVLWTNAGYERTVPDVSLHATKDTDPTPMV